MKPEVLEIMAVGLRASLQGTQRRGWRRFGVPPGGAMDDHAALFANRLLDNSPEALTLELLLQGAKLKVLRDVWMAVTGAAAHGNAPRWRAFHASAGDNLRFPRNESGVWTYIAVAGGFAAAPANRDDCAVGEPLRAGDRLRVPDVSNFQLPSRVAGRAVAWDEQRDYDHPPALRAWPGPQWDAFGRNDRAALLNEPWKVSPHSDRVGYRLEGSTMEAGVPQIISEPVRVGSIQVPGGGQPIVTMRDGPTVGGYPKIALVEPRDLSWLAQIRPGRTVRFAMMDPT